MSTIERILVILAGLLICVTYSLTFRGAASISERRDVIAFADSSEYLQLTRSHEYLQVLSSSGTAQSELLRKTTHHVGYVVVADGFVSSLTRLVPSVSASDAAWLLSPIVGAICSVLFYLLIRVEMPAIYAAPSGLAFASAPAIWIYSSVPETWMFCCMVVLGALHLRKRLLQPWLIGLLVAVAASVNFLLLLTVVLFADNRKLLRAEISRLLQVGVFAGVFWVALLCILGAALSPAFWPTQFALTTVTFKAGLAENLPIWSPFRWAYSGLNGWVVPFVLNQADLNFGRSAFLDTARNIPLGLMSCISVVSVMGATLFHYGSSYFRQVKTVGLVPQQIPALPAFLLLSLAATTLAAYFESFLYSPMVIPVLSLLVVRAVHAIRAPWYAYWIIAAIWLGNSSQQILAFRSLLNL